MTATVVVVGGGYGGITVAQALDDVVDVILVDPKDAFVHNVAALRAAVDPAWADKMFYPYATLLKRGEVIRDWVTAVEPRGVRLSSGKRLRADFIVVASGTTYPFPAKVDEFRAAAAKRRYYQLSQTLQQTDRVLILGAGPVGLELAGEIKSKWADKSVTVLEPAADILSRSFVSGFNPERAAIMRAELHRQLEAMDVNVLLGTSLSERPPVLPAEGATFETSTLSGRKLTVDIWFSCYGRRPVSGLIPENMAHHTRRRDGYLEVTQALNLPRHPNIFAIGDVAATPGLDSAVVAMEQAGLVAENIQMLMGGRRELKTYKPEQPLFLIPLGSKGGVTYSPDGGILDAETTAQFKGNDLFTGKYDEIFGLDKS